MQKVVVGSRSSPSFYCTKGVPQGSVLSPLLFNIYVSDVHRVAKENNSSLRSFADDMTLYHSDTSAEQASKTVGAALNIINGELVDLGLPINVEKSAALLICPSAKKSNHLPSTPPILLCGTPVNVVTEMRLLGVIVDVLNRLTCKIGSTAGWLLTDSSALPRAGSGWLIVGSWAHLPIMKDTHTQRLKMIVSMNDETREMNVRKKGRKKTSLRVHHEGASAGLVPSSFLWILKIKVGDTRVFGTQSPDLSTTKIQTEKL